MPINKIDQTWAIKDRREKFIDRLSKKRGWSFSDMNPYFTEVYEIMPKIDEALSYREYKRKLKLERKKHEKMAMLDAIRTSLCV